jgi:hypothetical protein
MISLVYFASFKSLSQFAPSTFLENSKFSFLLWNSTMYVSRIDLLSYLLSNMSRHKEGCIIICILNKFFIFTSVSFINLNSVSIRSIRLLNPLLIFLKCVVIILGIVFSIWVSISFFQLAFLLLLITVQN